MDWKGFSWIAACVAAAGLLACGGPKAPAGPPHIVFILADDMGYGDVRANNPGSRIPTPHIDRIAAEGLRFTDAHAPAAWCVPSRYGLLTGRYPVRSALRWREEAVIEPGTETLATMLRRQGYATAMVGKWHLGFDGGPDYDFTRPMTGGPLDHGFDSYFGIPASLDIPPYYYIRDRAPEAPPTERVAASGSDGWSPIQGAFWREGGVAPGFKHVEVLPRFTAEAVSLIERHAGADKPLFLYMALPAPHTPWLPTGEFAGKSEVGMYGDFMMQVDDTVGQILNALDRAGMAENALVIFASDNGPVWYDTDVDRFGHDAAGGLRGMKADSWEAGHRVPFLARWPGRIQPGGVSTQLLCFTDMMATLAAATGATPESAADSVNLWPAFTGEDGGAPIRDHLLIKEAATVMRQGDWKLITHLGSGGFSEPRRVEPADGGPRGQLYNLAEDLGETNNLWLERPDVVARLSGLLEGYQTKAESAP